MLLRVHAIDLGAIIRLIFAILRKYWDCVEKELGQKGLAAATLESACIWLAVLFLTTKCKCAKNIKYAQYDGYDILYLFTKFCTFYRCIIIIFGHIMHVSTVLYVLVILWLIADIWINAK
jgi:hypothetical protein